MKRDSGLRRRQHALRCHLVGVHVVASASGPNIVLPNELLEQIHSQSTK
jgi:hypothetical protein